MRGLRLETAAGLKRALLWATEWIACRCSHRVVCVSPSLRERAIGFNLVSPEKATVIEKGSGGVDARRFSPADRSDAETENLRSMLGIPTARLQARLLTRVQRHFQRMKAAVGLQVLGREAQHVEILGRRRRV